MSRQSEANRPTPSDTDLLAGLVSGTSDPLKHHLLENPDLFIVHYFPAAIQRLENFHLRLIETVTTQSRALILYPATHGKTTLVSTLLPIWAICRNPNIRIGIVAKNEADAKDIMRAIQAELLSNEDLINDFGPFYNDNRKAAWSLERLDVAKRTKKHKSATIRVFGSGSRNTLGYRTDWVICDDVVNQDNSGTPDRRYSLRQWFNQNVRTMNEDPAAPLTVVGTLFDPEDLYHDLYEMTYPDTGQPVYFTQREDAIVDEERQQTLWPARWPWKLLMEFKAEMGTLDFNKRFRNIAVDPSRQAIKEQFITGGWSPETKTSHPGCLDEGYVVGQYDPGWMRWAGFDPAVGLTRTAKFCAHVMLAVGSCPKHDQCYWVVDVERGQYTLPQQADLVIAKHDEYGAHQSVVEANSYQGGLMQVIQERMDRAGKQFRIMPHYTTRTNKPDPETGVQAMSPWFENGKVHIPWGNPESKRKMKQLIEELISYPDYRTSDTVMAFWFAWRASQVGGARYKSFSRLDKKPLRYAPNPRRRVLVNPWYAKKEEDELA